MGDGDDGNTGEEGTGDDNEHNIEDSLLLRYVKFVYMPNLWHTQRLLPLATYIDIYTIHCPHSCYVAS